VTVASILQRPYAATARAIAASPTRGPVAGGAVFIVFGVGKFTNHVRARVGQYIPPARTRPFAYLIGVIELAGGLLPPQPRRCRPAPGAKGRFRVFREHK